MVPSDRIKLLRLKIFYFALCRGPVQSKLPTTICYSILRWNKQKQSFADLFKMCVPRYFANFIGKHQCWSIFLIKLQAWRPATFLQCDSNTSVLLWNLRYFKEHLWWLLLNKSSRSLWFILWGSDALLI